jgi:hypothetical protein
MNYQGFFSLSWGNAFGKIQDSDGLQGPATFNPNSAVGVNNLRFVHGKFQRPYIWKLNKDHYLAYVVDDDRSSFEQYLTVMVVRRHSLLLGFLMASRS